MAAHYRRRDLPLHRKLWPAEGIPDGVSIKTHTHISVLHSIVCRAHASSGKEGSRGHAGSASQKDDPPLVQPSLVIPPPSTGSQYGRNRLLDLAFSGPLGVGGGGGDGEVGGGGFFGFGGRGGGAGGGGGRGPSGSRDDGSCRGRRFGVLPRVLVLIQFLCWSVVLYMLVDTVVNTSTRVSKKVWRTNSRVSGKEGRGQAAAAEPQGPQPLLHEPEPGQELEHGGEQEHREKGQKHDEQPEQGQRQEDKMTVDGEVVVVENEIEEVEEEEVVVTGDGAARDAIAEAMAGPSSSRSCSSTVLPPDGTEQPLATMAMRRTPDIPGVVAMGSVDGPAAAAAAVAAGTEALSGSPSPAHQAGQQRPPFVRYEGARPVEYPTLAVFIMILGSVGFFSTLG
ncbi:hypothetical protein VaNZ11_003719 [Volvox africanus]|uniref:Uncharacterized protein n=1 Tax=Volvox africanus TaxID=51714 RepID=A0ABQ5RWB7_9CHLO|nr:hypothetical protein VaNZ11_003719 [Volvox africanus]